MTIKVLNLYAGIGGNRELWTGVDVTAVELNPQIAAIYQDRFPDDTVIVADAHQFLLDHYKEFDFLWSSPPCPTHSSMRRFSVSIGQSKALYPDMTLYEEIILLKYFAPKDITWIVENVASYYDPLITPQAAGKHYFWSNFFISSGFIKYDNREAKRSNVSALEKQTGFDLSDYKIKGRKITVLRNCVDSKLGKHILDCAFKHRQGDLFDDN